LTDNIRRSHADPYLLLQWRSQGDSPYITGGGALEIVGSDVIALYYIVGPVIFFLFSAGCSVREKIFASRQEKKKKKKKK
jgi:hypothetical protein